MDITKEAAGIRVGQLRTVKGWSMRELARRAGLSVSYISNFEKGIEDNPRPLTLSVLASALDWSDWDTMMSTDALKPPPVQPAPVSGELLATIREVVREETALIRITPGPHIAAIVRPVLGDETRPVYSAQASTPNMLDPLNEATEEAVPSGRCAKRIGPGGYGVRVRGGSMEGLDVPDGSIAWVSPGENWQMGHLVLAQVWDEGESERRTVIKKWTQRQGITGLWSHDGIGWEVIPRDRYAILGRVVCVQWEREV
ncbi:MAG TPA: helix-turn-helix transcriptional regulator [Chloroflexota bacterium]|nr:helix-turn-helix transcriptional regulator [Chloroflexota bacterium]